MADKYYKQILVLSGKGGTGKTSISAALSETIPADIVIDADVDAANLNLVLNNHIKSKHQFFGGKKAQIDSDLCSKCGLCEDICRFDAITNFYISQISCEGCGFCFHICPNNAINFTDSQSGVFYNSQIETGNDLYFARLFAGEGNSGKLVTKLKKSALENLTEAFNKKNDNSLNPIKWIVIDGPPGIGCPVNASLSGVDYVVMVTEPTKSGLHDLKRLIELLKTFKTKSGLIINKYDLNSEVSQEIKTLALNNSIELLSLLPFDRDFVKAAQNAKSIIEYKKSLGLESAHNNATSNNYINYETEFKSIFSKINFSITS